MIVTNNLTAPWLHRRALLSYSLWSAGYERVNEQSLQDALRRAPARQAGRKPLLLHVQPRDHRAVSVPVY